MKFSVLALDYDGTIATEGVLDPDVRAAIIETRARGTVVLLVTGRILSDLRQAAGDLDFADAVVAENGAVLAFPNGYSMLIGHLPPQVFFDELRRRGIGFRKGQCIVEADAGSAPQILAVIRELELPLALLFNRSRLMVLPQAISKSTGLRKALNAFRLSTHNAIGIGDAENDNDLLAECEIAVAVSWGSAALQKQANEIVHGDGPRAVAAYIRQVSKETRLPFDRIGRHRISLGTAEDGRPLAIAIHGRNMLVVGEPQSGKSWATGLACEQMILQGYCVCVIDPEGDYSGLEALPGVVVLGGEDPPPDIPDVARALQHFDLSVVVDLSRVPYEEKVSYLKTLLPMLASLRRATGLPHRIVVDEAHYFLHEPDVKQLLDLELGAYALVTYRPSDLYPDLRKAMDVVVAKRLTNPQEVQTLLTMVKGRDVEPEWATTLRALAPSEAAILPGSDEAEGKLRRFTLLPRLTPHVRHKTKYFDVQLAGGQEFVFTDHGKAVGLPARSLKQFLALLASTPVASVGEHARRGDFSRWIANVFHDNRLASDVRKIEQRYRLGHLEDVRESMSQLIQERYRFSSDRALYSPATSNLS
ncbi:MAG: HAD hydrolase family protein [Candidatus Sulfotelmatobacter sp.]|jgi:hydroxymethylpyrimidine pyrophosphatase-like HAD family hydrolase